MQLVLIGSTLFFSDLAGNRYCATSTGRGPYCSTNNYFAYLGERKHR